MNDTVEITLFTSESGSLTKWISLHSGEIAREGLFEAPPILVAPLTQDITARQSICQNGTTLDTASAIPSLTAQERSTVGRKRCLACNLRDEAA